MKKNKNTQKDKDHLIIDIMVFVISIVFAFSIVQLGLVERLAESLHGYIYLGIFIAGMFFTSIFTTAPSIALLGTFALTNPVWVVALLGGLGSVVGDYIIFYFIKDRVSRDIDYLLSFKRNNRASLILRTKLFRFFVPLLGALIIASPFPDEIGIAMLGLSGVSNKIFLMLSFVLNGIGIYVIASLAVALF